MEKLKDFEKRLRESTEKSQNLKDYLGIIEFSKTSIETKELGADLIPRYFQFYTSHSNQAFDAYKDIIEAVDVNLTVRVQAIRKLPLFCKDAPELVSKIIDVLVQCLAIDQQEQHEAVHETFMSLFQQDTLSDLINKLPEPRKLDLLEALAEISPHTTTLIASEMLPPIFELLKKYMPARNTVEKSDSRYVECLLYVFHHMAHKVPEATNSLCGYKIVPTQPSDRIGDDFSKLYKESTERLINLEDLIKASVEQLVQEMSDHDKAYLLFDSMSGDDKAILYMKRQDTKTELRTCINILAMTEVLHAEVPSFIGDTNVVKLSWKEATKPLAYTRALYTDLMYGIPPDIDAFHNFMDKLSEDLLNKLDMEGMCELEDDQVQALVGSSGLKQAQDTLPESRIFLHENPKVPCLFWRIRESTLLKLVTSKSWKKFLGFIRDQLFHLICWAYAASDLVSATRIMRNWEVEYIPLCPWYLCSFCRPEYLGEDENPEKEDDENPEKGHYCYGNDIEDCLLYIKQHGIPREICKKFDCKDWQPPNADDPHMHTTKLKSVRKIESMEEALLLLPHFPIGADLVVFKELWTVGEEIYYGPGTNSRGFRSYHAVIVSSIEIYKGEVVAICKMSNGTKVCDEGYVRVSLATTYMVVGASPKKKEHVRATSKPMHLLSEFIIIDIDENEKEKEREREKETESEEENPEDNQKGNPEHNPKEKSEEMQYPDFGASKFHNSLNEHIMPDSDKSLGNVSGEEIKMVTEGLTSLSKFGEKGPQERMHEPVEIVERGKRPANEAGNDVGTKKARTESSGCAHGI